MHVTVQGKEVNKLPKRYLPKEDKYMLVMVDYEYVQNAEFNSNHSWGGEHNYTKSKNKALRVKLEDVDRFIEFMVEVWGVSRIFIDTEGTHHKGRSEVFSWKNTLVIH